MNDMVKEPDQEDELPEFLKRKQEEEAKEDKPSE